MAEVHQPTDVGEAGSILAELGDEAVAVAGGTDVLLERRLGRIDPGHLVDLSGLTGLDRVERHDGTFRVGALARLGTVLGDVPVRDELPALAEAAAGVGTPLVRNMATLGGNVCQAAPHGEVTPALLVHDAVATVAGPDGERQVATADLVIGPRETSLATGELLTAITVPAPADHGATYIPFDPAGVGVAVGLRVADGAVTEARVALCWCVPFPQRVADAEAALLGAEAITGEVLAQLAGAVAAACDPPHDPVYGPVDHRRHVAGVLSGRAARVAWQRAAGSWPVGELCPPGGPGSEEAT